MPRNLNAWLDICIIMIVTLMLVLVLATYNPSVGLIAFVLWACLLLFARERCLHRAKNLEYYCSTVITSVRDINEDVLHNLPQMVVITDKEGRLQWFNHELSRHLGYSPEYGTFINDQETGFWPELDLSTIWGRNGETVLIHDSVHYHMYYRSIATKDDSCGLMALYLIDDSPYEILKRIHSNSRMVLLYIQIDNFTDVLQGLNDAEKNQLSFDAASKIEDWISEREGFIRRLSDDLFVAFMEKRNLYAERDQMKIHDDLKPSDIKFDILDKIHDLENAAKKLPVTLSIGVAIADKQSSYQLASQAQSMLELALGRGGDQAALLMNGVTTFYGGKTKAIEKHNRVKARVVSNSIHKLMEESDEVFIMGHHNEDFDSLGAALGVSRMAKSLDKPVHIILSPMTTNVDKFIEILADKEEYNGLFITGEQLLNITAQNPILIVVDSFIPHLTAEPDMLERIKNIVVIDHHRRSENSIPNPKLLYLEPGTSSTCEMVTELLMYFSDDLAMTRHEASALYSGIIVDTKNFSVQVGVRTFDAASFLRRCGADPVTIRQMFRTDLDTEIAKAKAKANAKVTENGLIMAICPAGTPNIQVVAAQVADNMLRIEKIRTSITVFQLTPDTIGVSARSTGEINVQVIMEHFGGGGHQNVAGTQIKDRQLEDVYNEVFEYTNKFIEEYDKNESNITEGR